MYCPICDQKPMNCDCTESERRMHAEIQEFQEQVPQWIPVEERLPEPSSSEYEDGVRVLAWSKGNGIDPAWFYRDSESGDRWSWDSTTQPTHWMPLPEPPSAL